MTSGGRSASAFVPRAVPVGDEDDDRGRAPCAGAAASGSVSGARMAAIGIRRHERQVDRQDEDRVRAARDDVGACLGEAGVEAA